MKNHILLFIVLFTANNFVVKSQAQYEKGYFIDTLGVKTECLIDNKDWEVTPTEISYKLSEQSERLKMNTSNLQEFEIFGYSKFINKVVQIDKSSSNISELTFTKNPIWKTQRLLLKELVNGKASLYKYSEFNLTRFFYAVNDSSIQQLVYKTYQSTNDNLERFVGTNNNFRQQLFVDVNIPNYKYDLSKIMYEQKELTTYFEDYNTQFDTNKTVIQIVKSKKDFFKAAILVGVNYSSMKVVYVFHPVNSQDFGAYISPTVGAEFEFTLPLGRNNWSILLQPVYNSTISRKLQVISSIDNSPMENEFSYQGIDIPMGLRYRYSLNSKLNVYATGYVETGIMSWYKTSISVDQKPFVVLIERALTPGFSLGVDYNNIGLELKAFANKDFIVRQQTVRTDFNVVSLVFKYRLIDLKINR